MDLVLASLTVRWPKVVLSQKTAVSHVCIISSASKKKRWKRGREKRKKTKKRANGETPLAQMNRRQV